jgi:AcrR family transcriptional regulator
MTKPDAAGLSSERLRRSVVAAAIPLMGSYHTVTTAQIAHAAGVDEADLLRVFDNKDAVLRACVAVIHTAIAAALDPGPLLGELHSISVDQPLAARLIQVVDALDTYYGRVRANLDALPHSVTQPQPDTLAVGEPALGPRSFSRDDLRAVGRLPETHRAVANLFQPDQEDLRLPVDLLADAFLGMALGPTRTPHPQRSPLRTEQLVDLFLHGALTAT